MRIRRLHHNRILYKQMGHPIVKKCWEHSEYMAGNYPARRLKPYRRTTYRGGNRRRRTPQTNSRRFPISINGHNIIIKEAEGDSNTLVLYGGRPDKNPPCFKLTLNPATGEAVLDDLKMPPLSAYPKCFEDNHSDAKLVVRVAYNLAKSHGIRVMDFTDNSSKHCSETGTERIYLGDFYRLLTGKTWYETVLLAAGAKSVRLNDAMYYDTAQLDADSARAAAVSWNTMRGTIASPPLPADLDPNAPGSARQMLRHLRSKDDEPTCQYIARNLGEFLRNSGIRPVFGTTWRCEF